MSWLRAFSIWFVIIVAESIHGAIRQAFVAPAIGDLRAHQLGVLIGSAIIFLVAWFSIRWLGAKSSAQQLEVGVLWVILTVVFEFSLGALLGYSHQRMLSDYNIAEGGLMGFGLLFMLFAPVLAARARGLR